MRLSMHPGQYTVLNSPDEKVYRRALDDLEYHNAVLDLLGLDSSHIISSMVARRMGIRAVIETFSETWPGRRQKVHNFDQDSDKGKGAHSGSVNIKLFGNFIEEIRGLELDVMLEVQAGFCT